ISSRAGEHPGDAPRPGGGHCLAGGELDLPGARRRAVIVAAVLASYLLGSIPFGLLVARAAAGKDVRAVGSGNIGATNVARAAGRGAAAATLALDAVKGFAPAFLASRFAAALGLPWAGAACGVWAVVGRWF